MYNENAKNVNTDDMSSNFQDAIFRRQETGSAAKTINTAGRGAFRVRGTKGDTPNTFPLRNSSHCPDIISTECQINLHLLVLRT